MEKGDIKEKKLKSTELLKNKINKAADIKSAWNWNQKELQCKEKWTTCKNNEWQEGREG